MVFWKKAPGWRKDTSAKSDTDIGSYERTRKKSV